MEYIKEDNEVNKKKKLRKLIINFFTFIIFLTFFSNTINNFSLPKVTAENPISDAIVKEINASGSVEPKESIKVYGEQGSEGTTRTVENILVKAGDKVKAGQLLLTLKKQDQESKLNDENINLNNYISKLEILEKGKLYKQNDLQRKIEEAKEKMDYEKKNLEIMQKLVKDGVETQASLDKQVMSYNDAKRNYEEAKNNYDSTLNDIDSSMNDVKYSIEMEKAKIDKINKDINSQKDIISPCDGVVKEVSYEKGQTVDGTKPIFVINNTNKGFQFKMSIDIDNLKYVAVGDSVDIDIKSLKNKDIKGKVIQIVDENSEENKNKTDDTKKKLIIDVEQEEFTGGESGTGTIKKKIGEYSVTVSNSAINSDDKGKFVWVLREKKGFLGNESYIKKAPVTVGENDGKRTAVLSGITAEDKVVVKVEDNKNVSDGSSVMVKN